MKRKQVWRHTTALWRFFRADRRQRTDLPINTLWLIYSLPIQEALRHAHPHSPRSRFAPLVLSGALTGYPDRYHKRRLRNFNRIMFAAAITMATVLWFIGTVL